MAIPSIDTISGLDTSDNQTRGMSDGASFGPAQGGVVNPGSKGATVGYDDRYLLKLAQEATSQSSNFLQQSVRAYWARSYKAFRNQHFEGSKYNSPEYAGRSKYFRPKTRTAVLKKMANAAQSLFGTGDVVAVSAEDASNDLQVASAALKQELINYRLSRTSRRNGIRWFQTCMGALQTGQITGLCISKQSWRYREETGQGDQRGDQGFSGAYKAPAVIEDRPSIDLLAPENVLFDPNCDWTDPAQSSQYVIVRNPMSVDEAMTMIQQNLASGDASFRSITRQEIQAHMRAMGPGDTVAPRTAREGGKDPKAQASGNFGRVWLYEVFMRVGNTDMVYWTLDNQKMISSPIPVRKAYPAFGGERPVVIGYCAFEAFRAYPMSPVESWQPMQMETNDQVNLRLDHMKQVVTPRAKVVRGKKIDLQQVQRQGPNGIVMVNDSSDVEWWEPPDVPPSAYQENNLLTGDFDSLAGVFDAGSVANNREMNETVGGMRLLAGSVNPMGEFDLNVFVETWVEPVLWQLLKLEEYYESDATVLMLAGQRAQLWEKFGISEITDELLTREATLSVKVGVGSSSLPEERIKKFASAASVVMGVLDPFIKAQAIKPPMPNVKEIVSTVFGAAGFQDGGDRFFNTDEQGAPPQPGPDPAAMADAQVKQQAVQVQAMKAQLDHHAKMATLDQKKAETVANLEQQRARSLAEIGKALLDQNERAATQGREHAHQTAMKQAEHAHGMMKDQINSDINNGETAQAQPPAADQSAAPTPDMGAQPVQPSPQPAPMGAQPPQPATQPQPAPQQYDMESRLRAEEIRRRMARNEELHKAVMDHIKQKSRPIRVVRGADGKIAALQH